MLLRERGVRVVCFTFLLRLNAAASLAGMFWLIETYAGLRPAGECTCERATTENHPVTGEACPCGKRPEGMFSLFYFALSGAVTDYVDNSFLYL
jgi:hypothetical protein